MQPLRIVEHYSDGTEWKKDDNGTEWAFIDNTRVARDLQPRLQTGFFDVTYTSDTTKLMVTVTPGRKPQYNLHILDGGGTNIIIRDSMFGTPQAYIFVPGGTHLHRATESVWVDTLVREIHRSLKQPTWP